MNINDYVPLMLRRLRPQSRPKETACMITRLAKAYGLENIGEIDEQFLNGFTCASDIVIAQLEKEFESDNKGEWIYDKGIENWRCSKCGQAPPPTGYVGNADFMVAHFKFCNHCGTDMRDPKDILHKAIDNTTFAEEVYPNIKEELHKAVDMAESEGTE